jgi:hypothetical protein
MVEPILRFPSSMLGSPHHENGILDFGCSIQAREKAPYGVQERWTGELEGRDAQQQSSRLGGYGAGTLLDDPQGPWFRHSVSEKHMQRQPDLEDMERYAASDFLRPESSSAAPVVATQRVHSERLLMVGAVDKTETRGLAEQEQSGSLSSASGEKKDQLQGQGRPHWDFSNLAASSTGSKRSMTVNEVRLIQSIGQAVICTDLEGNITYW